MKITSNKIIKKDITLPKCERIPAYLPINAIISETVSIKQKVRTKRASLYLDRIKNKIKLGIAIKTAAVIDAGHL